jgi:caa(3)-type oxidase subunit IV
MSSNEHADHSPLFSKVMWALMGLTVVTVAISRIHLGSFGNWTLGLAVAVVKASLVVLIFMHLKWEKRWWLAMVLFPILLVGIILCSNLPDTGMSSQHLSPAVQRIHGGGAAGGHGGGGH